MDRQLDRLCLTRRAGVKGASCIWKWWPEITGCLKIKTSQINNDTRLLKVRREQRAWSTVIWDRMEHQYKLTGMQLWSSWWRQSTFTSFQSWRQPIMSHSTKREAVTLIGSIFITFQTRAVLCSKLVGICIYIYFWPRNTCFNLDSCPRGIKIWVQALPILLYLHLLPLKMRQRHKNESLVLLGEREKTTAFL